MLQRRKGSRAQAQVCDCTLPKTMTVTAASVATFAIDMAENGGKPKTAVLGDRVTTKNVGFVL